MPNVLITGCSSGIGYDTAIQMRAAGWRVFDVVDEPEEFFLRARRA